MRIRLLLTICLLSLPLSMSFAQDKDITLMVNELKVFPVYKLQRVAIGDPAIADVSVVSGQELMLIAKTAGTTGLIIWDESGQRSFNINVLKKDLEKIGQRIRELLDSLQVKGVNVGVKEDGIYVSGFVLSEVDEEKVKNILAPFSEAVNLVKVRERQPLVEIEVNVLEVAFDDEKNLGLDFSSSLPIRHSEPATNREDSKILQLWRVLHWDRSALDASLNLLIEEDKARTLANPRLVTLSGKEASFLVGGEIPYVTVEDEGRTEVEWRDYGVTLTILPVVSSKGEIRTKIEAEISDLDWANAVTESSHRIPAMKIRKAQTELFLNPEDTLFIGGLIKNEDSRNVSRLPWLSNVPVLGELFKSTQFQDKRTELVISITPRIIITSDETEYAVAEAKEGDTLISVEDMYGYEEGRNPLAYYTHMIEDIIACSVAYPSQAEEADLEGVVKIDVCILPNGHLQEVRIKESSGYRSLDESALIAVQEQSPYPSFPDQLSQKELRLTIPVVFKKYVQNEE